MIPSVKVIEARLRDSLVNGYGEGSYDKARLIRAALGKAVNYETVDIALEECNWILRGYGVEGIKDNGWEPYYLDIGLLYVNMGYTYANTVIYNTRKDIFYITSWGDIVEGNSKRFMLD